MQFVVDPIKSATNYHKHGTTLEQAIAAFDDPAAFTFGAHIENGELRLKTLATISGVLILLIVHTHIETTEDETIGLISARKADKSERKLYEKNYAR